MRQCWGRVVFTYMIWKNWMNGKDAISVAYSVFFNWHGEQGCALFKSRLANLPRSQYILEHLKFWTLNIFGIQFFGLLCPDFRSKEPLIAPNLCHIYQLGVGSSIFQIHYICDCSGTWKAAVPHVWWSEPYGKFEGATKTLTLTVFVFGKLSSC